MRVQNREIAALLPLVLVAALVVYKSAGAARDIAYARANHALAARTGVVSIDSPVQPLRAAARSVNYFAVVWPALTFGILISASVRAFVPAQAVARLLSGGLLRSQLVAGASGAPLMLCSCCAAPLFASVYERSRQLAPSLAVMLAAPALNPAALVLTFLLFPAPIAWGRLLMSVAAVSLGTMIVARAASGARIGLRALSVDGDEIAQAGTIVRFVRASLHVSAHTVPVLVIGVAAAMFLADAIGAPEVLSTSFRVWSIAVTAAIAVPLPLPTFFEIPLATSLLAAGAPAGAAAALLFAGPAVNLASLLTVGQEAGWKTVALVMAMVWLVAVAGGLAIG